MNEPADISCDDALKRLFAYLDRELDRDAHREMEHHLSRCRGCFSRVDFEKRLKQRLRETGSEEAPAQLQARVRALLQKY